MQSNKTVLQQILASWGLWCSVFVEIVLERCWFNFLFILEAAVCGAFGLYWVTLNIIILEEVVMVSWSLGNHRVSCHTNINRHILQYTGLMRLVLASSQLTSVQLIRDHYETINIHGEKQSSGQFAWKGHIHMVAILSWHHAQGGN